MNETGESIRRRQGRREITACMKNI